jgi:hypothetical protein
VSVLQFVVLSTHLSIHFWEMARVDGLIDLEVSNTTITNGGDAGEDGMGTQIELVWERGAHS